ncbi:speedy protein A-like [Phymastichus coffea]|uniref:speedy protein A-like n=1 Tax=Phymastichus coffea TaxID=108790 RepID=UPI00273B1193|nr:speedy protein A-like [Phymastichus coffea]XP_058805660.1 speedy protein A-like [Phymastichus coffea]XP_058805661.1 speedy protein A-like [Phymastichus coffea]XP_058805662.1 speedy protein A-like [Phymastichus coffea]
MNLLVKRDFAASPYKSERDKLIYVKRLDVRRFFKLLEKLDDFLQNDRCCRLADNYLIAMVFTYFLRASFEPEEYTKQNFFAALFLAYNMEEDEGEFSVIELEDWLDCSLTELRQLRYELFRRIDHRGAVSRSCCEVVMRCANPEHKIWQRRRHLYHSGIVSKNTWWPDGIEKFCPVCEGESDEDTDYERKTDVHQNHSYKRNVALLFEVVKSTQ